MPRQYRRHPNDALAAARLRALYNFLERCPARRVEKVRHVVHENKYKGRKGGYRYASSETRVPVYAAVALLSCGHERTFAPGLLQPVVGGHERCPACGPTPER